mmetsp:Transcript_10370/g.40333  ORF Transcript_10370/g.40333 Transcript_10370/m.40333 type:complete len:202 (-) Transcript_10370:525-1130(-)
MWPSRRSSTCTRAGEAAAAAGDAPAAAARSPAGGACASRGEAAEPAGEESLPRGEDAATCCADARRLASRTRSRRLCRGFAGLRSADAGWSGEGPRAGAWRGRAGAPLSESEPESAIAPLRRASGARVGLGSSGARGDTSPSEPPSAPPVAAAHVASAWPAAADRAPAPAGSLGVPAAALGGTVRPASDCQSGCRFESSAR